jgi:hypothetical protein
MFLSPIELAEKVCVEGGMSICPIYPTRLGISLHLKASFPERLLYMIVLHLDTKSGALLAHFFSTVLDDFFVFTRREVGLLVNYIASHVRR